MSWLEGKTTGIYSDMAISDLAELHFVTIKEMFPALSFREASRIDEVLLDLRSINTLRRRHCTTWGDLQAITVGDLWNIPNAGRLTVERILTAARDMAAQSSDGQNRWAPNAGIEIDRARAKVAVEPNFGAFAVRTFAMMLADWAIDTGGASTVGDLLEALKKPMPRHLVSAFADIERLDLNEIMPKERTVDTAALIVDFLAAVGSDARFVVERHIANPSGRVPTLESLGEGAGLTRERVRQIINRGNDRALKTLATAEYRLLSWRADELRRTLNSTCRVDSPGVDEAIARAARGLIDPVGCTAREFMLWVAGEYREHDGWWLSGDAGRLETVLRSVRSALDGHWLLRSNELVESIRGAGIVIDIGDTDIAEFTSWRSIGDDWWVRWDGSLGDKAERIFRLALRALHPDEINEMIGAGHAKSSVQNILSSDERFTRVSMDLDFALTEWGWEEYSTAAQEIAERIERAGGEAVLNDVVVELFNQFGLKEATVRAYASSPAFVIANGRIRVRPTDQLFQVNDRIASAPGLYVRGDGCVVFHITVDADVLRGSGRSIPKPMSVALGVRPGETRDFSAGDLGRVRVTWPLTAVTGASIGSIRLIAERAGADFGDVLRLVFDLDAEYVEGSVVSGTSLMALTGLTLTHGSEAVEVAAALRVATSEVRAALHDRGDGVVAALIPVPRPSQGLDDALSRLDGLLR